MLQAKLNLEPESAPAGVWIVEFWHPHFRWLDLDTKYPTRELAELARDQSVRRCPDYPCRVRRIA